MENLQSNMWWCLSIFFLHCHVSAMITMSLLLLSCQWKHLNLIFNFTVAILCAKTFFATGAVVFSRVTFVFICFFLCRCPSNRSEYEDSSHQDEFQQDQNYWRFFPGNLFYMQNRKCIAKLPEKNSPERWSIFVVINRFTPKWGLELMLNTFSLNLSFWP